MWRRSCMKNNWKSPTFKLVPGEESRPLQVQRVSRSRRLPGTAPVSADLIWTRKWVGMSVLKLFARATTDRRARLKSRSTATSGSDRARTGRSHAANLRSHFVIRACRAPEWLRAQFSSGLSLSETKENWRERRLPRPSTPQTLTHTWNSFSSELSL